MAFHSYTPPSSNLHTQPRSIAVARVADAGVRTYIYNNGTIIELLSSGSPATPADYNTWPTTDNFSDLLGITNVFDASHLSAVGYTSPTTQDLVIRVFYQATNGDIRSAWYSNGWQLDPTVIANVPLGTPIAAMQQSNSGGQVFPFAYY